MAALAVSTIAAVLLALGRQPDWSGLSGITEAPRLLTAGGFAFLLALVGWMPIPIEVAAWHSLWTRERAQQTGQSPSVRDAILDFRIGFIGATALACAFVLLGAMLMYASGLRCADSAVGFSAQLAVSAGALLILQQAGAAFPRLIDFATTLSFLSAPLRAWITLRAVTGLHMPLAARPGRSLLTLAWLSLLFGIAFSVAWLAWLLID